MPDESQKPVSILRRPNVVPLAMAAFFNDMGSDMLFAFYPLFFIIVLQSDKPWQLGLIETLALTAGLLIRPFMGKLADKQGRKKFIAVGYVCLFLSRLIQGLANVWWHLVPPKLLYEFGRGMRNPPRSALIADSVPKEQRGLAFGIQEGMDTFGAVLGPLLGIWLFHLFTKAQFGQANCYRLIFAASAMPTIVSFFIILGGVRDVSKPREAPSPKPAAPAPHARFPLLQDRTLFVFTLVSCLFSLLAVSENYMVWRGFQVLNIKPNQAWEAVLLYWFINITFAPMAFLAGKWSDKHGRKIMVILSFILLGLLTLGFGYVTSYAGFAILFLMHGFHRGLLVPCQTALVADLAPADRRAEVLGSYQMWTGYFAIPAPFLFGILVSLFHNNWVWPFVISGVVVLLCAGALMAFLPADRKPSEGSAHGR
jgi:MFS family permease